MMNTLPTNFALPQDANIYILAIKERCHHLIGTGIWHGIDHLKLDTWLNNFETEEEKYFAACLLDALIYRSHDQTSSLLFELFERVIPQILREVGSAERSWLSLLRESPDSVGREVIVVPVIRSNDPPTKSGPVVARMYRRVLGIDDGHMSWPWRVEKLINSQTQAILFIDDFIGTGRQFVKFIKDFELEHLIDGKLCLYAAMVAHVRGIKHLQGRFGKLKVAAAEVITAKLDLFSDESDVFNDGVNTASTAKAQYKQILSRIGFTNSSLANGFGRLGLAYGFDHGTPNNSIPLFWWSSPKWKPLLKR